MIAVKNSFVTAFDSFRLFLLSESADANASCMISQLAPITRVDVLRRSSATLNHALNCRVSESSRLLQLCEHFNHK